jgi:hypothetical protein
MNRVKRIKDLSRMDYRASGKDTVEISAASSAASSVASSVTSSKRKKSESSESVMSKKSKKKKEKKQEKKGSEVVEEQNFSDDSYEEDAIPDLKTPPPIPDDYFKIIIQDKKTITVESVIFQFLDF